MTLEKTPRLFIVALSLVLMTGFVPMGASITDEAPVTGDELTDEQQQNLDTAETLLDILENEHETDLDKSVQLAMDASARQAETLGVDVAEPIPLQGYEEPSQALLTLADRHDAEVPAEELEQVRALDEEPVSSALATFVDAYLALDTAVTLAYQDADVDALEALAQETEATGSDGALEDAGVDLSHVFPTRNQFLDAATDLADALSGASAAQSTCDPVQVAPAFSIDLTNCSNTYTDNYALQLDAGGSDGYYNNAGGSNVLGGCLPAPSSAALVNLGQESDEFGSPDDPLRCGANGGGHLGSGLLLTEGGHDTYSGTNNGVNGGASLGGVGLVVDAAGDDNRTGTSSGVNGGGAVAVGLLVDSSGDDVYDADSQGANGGGFIGSGFLVDVHGDDEYTALEAGVNGAGNLGSGFLLDAHGDDTYTGTDQGVNGGAIAGTGLLLDQSGDDEYTATGGLATNGGGLSGAGLLADLGGEDSYEDAETQCDDCSAVKGVVGVQFDSDDPLFE